MRRTFQAGDGNSVYTSFGEDAESGVCMLGAFKTLDIPSLWENISRSAQLELRKEGDVESGGSAEPRW